MCHFKNRVYITACGCGSGFDEPSGVQPAGAGDDGFEDDSSKDCRHAHLRLADYFQSSELSPREVDERPCLLAEAAAWQPLYDLHADLAFFHAGWEVNRFEVKAHWALIEEHPSLQMVGA